MISFVLDNNLYCGLLIIQGACQLDKLLADLPSCANWSKKINNRNIKIIKPTYPKNPKQKRRA